MMVELFPDYVVTCEADPQLVYHSAIPEEAGYIANAVPRRRMQFLAGRVCARRALATLGIAAGPIPVAKDRSPVWPHGVVGCISHVDGYCGAAVARTVNARGIGFDIEYLTSVLPEFVDRICGPSELVWLHALPSEDRQRAASLIFSAKEAVYKCVHPIVKEWLDFHDVAIVPDVAGGTFRSEFLVDYERFGKGSAVNGAFAFYKEYVCTAIVMGV